MPDIKTKDSNPLKRLPAAVPRTALKMKDTAIKAKQKAEDAQQIKQHSPSEYAVDKVAEKSRRTVDYTALKVRRFAKKRLIKRKKRIQAHNVQYERDNELDLQAASYDNIADNRVPDVADSSRSQQKPKRKTNTKKKADFPPTKSGEKSAFSMLKKDNVLADNKASAKFNPRMAEKPSFSPRVRYPEKKTIKQPDFVMNKTIKGRADGIKFASGKIKPGGKVAGSAAKNGRTAIKTAQTVQKARKTAQKTVKNNRRAVQASRKAAKQSAKGVKRIAKALKSTVKAIIKAVKWLIMAIAAGGWIAVLIILIIGMVGMLISSVYGIFFSGEVKNERDMTIPAVIREINLEYLEQIESIKSENTHDEAIITGDRAPWKEILAIYAVKVNTDPENPSEIMTMDKFKKIWLKDIFWDMNVLSHSTAERETTETVTETDDKGKETTKEITTKKKTLTITVNAKTALDMAQEYGFNEKQMDMLNELLSPEFDSLWNSVLYGTSTGSTDIVEVAASQLGNVGGQPYWSWYGFSNRVDWCACFVSWCANECGYIEAGTIPKFAGCTSGGMGWFKAQGRWQERGYEPMPGDIIFFDWDFSGDADHVGIVEKCEGGVVYTIEGNSDDTCQRQSYSVNNSFIRGYGVPNY